MPLPIIPSIKEISERIVSDIDSKINQNTPSFMIAFNKVIARANAAFHYLQYMAILWVLKQLSPLSCDEDILPLHGALTGIERGKAVKAVILCTVPGSGPQVDQGVLFQGQNKIVYSVTTTTSITGGEALNVPMQALESGNITNLANGEVLNIVQTTAGLNGTATVTDTQTSGADQQAKDVYAANVDLGYRTRYVTGSPAGYAENGLKTPNFIWIGVYSDPVLPTTVIVYGKVSNQPGGIPTASQLDELKEYLRFDPATGKEYNRVTGDILDTRAITNREFDIEVFINKGTPDIETLAENALNSYIDTLAPFIIGISSVRNDTLTGTEAASAANFAVRNEGAYITKVVVTDVAAGSVIDSYTFFGGEFAVFRNITFTDVP